MMHHVSIEQINVVGDPLHAIFLVKMAQDDNHDKKINSYHRLSKADIVVSCFRLLIFLYLLLKSQIK